MIGTNAAYECLEAWSVWIDGSFVAATLILLWMAAAHWQIAHSRKKWLVGEKRQRLRTSRLKRALKRYWFYKRMIDIWKWHGEKWQKCGYKTEEVHRRSDVWLLVLGTLGLMTLWSSPLQPWKAVLAVVLMEGLFWAMTEVRIKERQVEFATGVYKIYRYLALQMTAGMSATETVKYLHEAVEQPFLKEAMYSFSSCYFRTMDLDLATEELTKRIQGDEIMVLAAVLRQGILTGAHFDMIQKQEQLMLRRYYAALEIETNLIHAKGVGIAILLCLLVFVLLALPMLYEMGRASKMIFI